MAAYVFVAGFVSLGVMVLLWFTLVATLFRKLKSDHHDTYVQLGEPSLFWNNSIKNNFAFIGFLLGGKYKALNDRALTLQCTIMVWFFWLYLAIFIITGIAMFTGQAQLK